MNERARRALALMLAGLALGVVGEVLRTWVPARLDVMLWIATFLLVALALVRARVLTTPPHARWLGAAAWVLVPCLAWRDAPALFALDLLALAGLLVLAAPGTRLRSLGRIGGVDLLRGGASLAGATFAGALPATVHDIRWADIPVSAPLRRLAGVAAGLAAATPVLLVFGALLGEADPLFRRSWTWIWSFDLGGVGSHLAFVGVTSWLAAGLLRGGFWWEDKERVATPAGRGRVTPAAVVSFVGAVGVLLLAFVLFQARELFLDAGEFQRLLGTTIAEYARRGFFELVWVATLTLPLLLGADWLLSRDDPRAVRRFRYLTTGVLVLLTLILASALHRMLLYAAFYGLTEDRFYTLAFMLWLGGVCGWFAITVLRGRRSRFVPGALLAAYAVLMALHVVNPDATVARVNLRRAAGGATLDSAYLARLSADAVPAILRGAPALSNADRCAMWGALDRRWESDVRQGESDAVWNLSRRAARRQFRAAASTAPACPATGPGPQGTDARL